MKLGILTTYHSFEYNYGAALQGFALARQLQILGHECYVINYIGNEWTPSSNTIRDRFKYIFDGGNLTMKLLQRLYKKKRLQNHKVFETFVDRNIPIYNRNNPFFYSDLKKIAREFDGFICGSDQIWNPLIHKRSNDKGYFLDFVNKDQIKIAYAPSIGINIIPEECVEEFKILVNNFRYLSVREETGAKIIKDLTGKDVKVVLDPTLLLEPQEYESISLPLKSPHMPDEYILCYKWGDIDETNEEIKRLSKKLKLPVFALPLSRTVYTDGYPILFNAGPSEFISLIKNATLLCTDSFHATVFALINNTPFITFCRERPKKDVNMNSRMMNLLEKLDLTDRMIMPGEKFNDNELFNIDFNKSNKLLSEYRKDSFNYLIDALNGK